MANKNLINVTNLGGTSGSLDFSDGMKIDLQPPAIENPSEQMSPKHLIGMAWSTCLNATIKSIFNQNKIENISRVRVEVEQNHTKELGLYYIVIAYVAIDGYSENETLKIANMADRLCPVSKLITLNQFVSLEYEKY